MPTRAAWQDFASFDGAPAPDDLSESIFYDLAALAARLCETSGAMLLLADGPRLVVKTQLGLTAEEVARVSRCGAEAMARTELFVEAQPPAETPSMVACAPLVAPSGEALGALCVADCSARELNPEHVQALQILARQVVAQLELRRHTVELAQQAHLLRAIFDSEPECVKLVDRSGTLRMMNRAGLEMLETDSLDQVIGRNVLDFVAEEDRDACRAVITRVFSGNDASLLFQAIGVRHGRRWLDTRAVPLRDHRGAVAALLGITRDITERRLSEIELRESEMNFRMLFERATEGIFVTDGVGRFLDVNDAGCRMTGWSREELLRRSVADIVAADDVPRVAEEIARLSTQRSVTSEWETRRKDGTPLIAELAVSRLPDGRLQAFARDITDRRRAETALRESDSRLRQAVHAGRVGLFEWEPATDRIYYSLEWKSQIGFEDHEIANEFEEWRSRVHPEDLPDVERRIVAFLGSPADTFEVEYRLRHKNGSYRYILTQGSKISDEEGRAPRVIGSHVDVTERTELQAQLLQVQKMESVGRLAGGVAHDFNNLLTVINGMADLAIASVDEDNPLRPELHEIRLAGDRAARLTRQLLAMSRQQVLKPAVLNLTEIVSNMERMIRRMIGANVTLDLNLSAETGAVKVDLGQIEQVILNLVVNARDAMPDGGRLTIAVCAVALDAAFAAVHPSVVPGSYARLSVTDTGLGMDAATLKRVFEPFFTTKETGKGTGLGLSTVYGIVKQSGGTVWASSRPGQGTTFTVYLPSVMDVPVETVARGLGDDRPASGSETILLVEDEQTIRELMRRILQSAGYTVVEAGSGEEALERLQEGIHPDLVVTDVVMPGMSGRELANQLAVRQPQLKVLFTSGYTADAILHDAVRTDSRRFMAKPYSPAELKRRVRDLLDA